MQKLLLPQMAATLLCGYKAPPYKAYWGYEHYGWDTFSGGATAQPLRIVSPGVGTVIAAGRDSRVGNVLVLHLPQALNHYTGQVQDIICRLYHLADCAVKKGDAILPGQLLGTEGDSGTGSVHLHLELDTDTVYPCHSPQVAGGSLILKGIDSTLNPCQLLHIGPQQMLLEGSYGASWYTPKELALPKANANNDAPTPFVAYGHLGQFATPAAAAQKAGDKGLVLYQQ